MQMSSRQRAVLVLTVFVTVLCLLAMVFVHFMADWQSRAHKRFTEIEAMYARLDGVVHAGGNLAAASVSAEDELKAQIYPASIDAVKAGNDILQRLRTLAEARGMVVVSSQVLPPPEPQKFERLLVELTGNLSLESLQLLLKAMNEERPAMAIEELQLTPVRRGSDYEPQMVLCRIVAFSLRVPK